MLIVHTSLQHDLSTSCVYGGLRNGFMSWGELFTSYGCGLAGLIDYTGR